MTEDIKNTASETEESAAAKTTAEDCAAAEANAAAEDVRLESAEPAKEATKETKKFPRKKKDDKKIEELNAKIAEQEDRIMRQMAEFENFRKRTEKEKAAMFETGQRSAIEKILPIVDNFERGLATISEAESGTPFADGMQMIYKQLMTELESLRVKPIEAVGKEFDPAFHAAVMQVESDEYESGIVAQELQKGYMLGDSVIRYSMVAVVQ